MQIEAGRGERARRCAEPARPRRVATLGSERARRRSRPGRRAVTGGGPAVSGSSGTTVPSALFVSCQAAPTGSVLRRTGARRRRLAGRNTRCRESAVQIRARTAGRDRRRAGRDLRLQRSRALRARRLRLSRANGLGAAPHREGLTARHARRERARCRSRPGRRRSDRQRAGRDLRLRRSRALRARSAPARPRRPARRWAGPAQPHRVTTLGAEGARCRSRPGDGPRRAAGRRRRAAPPQSLLSAPIGSGAAVLAAVGSASAAGRLRLSRGRSTARRP